MAYCTQYMEAYRSPHESPTGQEGATAQIVTLKMENKRVSKRGCQIDKLSNHFI